MIKKVSTLSLSAAVYLSLAPATFASSHRFIQTCPKQAGNNLTKLCEYDLAQVGKVIRTGITLMFITAMILALVFLVYGGIKWITSGGDKAKLEGARSTIIASIVGLILVFSSYFILNVVLQIFGFQSISKFTIPTLNN